MDIEEAIKITKDYLHNNDVIMSNNEINALLTVLVNRDILDKQNKELKKGIHTLMESRKKWKNRYYKVKKCDNELKKALIEENMKLQLENIGLKEYKTIAIEEIKDIELEKKDRQIEKLQEDISNMYDAEVVYSVLEDEFNLTRSEIEMLF